MSSTTFTSSTSIDSSSSLFGTLLSFLSSKKTVPQPAIVAHSVAVPATSSITGEALPVNLWQLYRLSKNSDSVNPAVAALLAR